MARAAERKAQSRGRIVEAASRLFRERGYKRTSVDELMAAAGLTRGGFYAHFRNKAALFEAALAAAFEESHENLLRRGLEELDGESWLRRAGDRYLSSDHVGNTSLGCAIPSLGGEVARAETSVRRAFGVELDRLFDRLAERLGGGAKARVRAIRRIATWAGALTMARAVADPALRDEILAACRPADPDDR